MFYKAVVSSDCPEPTGLCPVPPCSPSAKDWQPRNSLQRDAGTCWARSCTPGISHWDSTETRLRLDWDSTGKATQVTLGLWLARRLSSRAFCRAPSRCVNLSSILQTTTGLNSNQHDQSSLIIHSCICLCYIVIQYITIYIHVLCNVYMFLWLLSLLLLVYLLLV